MAEMGVSKMSSCLPIGQTLICNAPKAVDSWLRSTSETRGGPFRLRDPCRFRRGPLTDQLAAHRQVPCAPRIAKNVLDICVVCKCMYIYIHISTCENKQARLEPLLAISSLVASISPLISCEAVLAPKTEACPHAGRQHAPWNNQAEHLELQKLHKVLFFIHVFLGESYGNPGLWRGPVAQGFGRVALVLMPGLSCLPNIFMCQPLTPQPKRGAHFPKDRSREGWVLGHMLFCSGRTRLNSASMGSLEHVAFYFSASAPCFF